MPNSPKTIAPHEDLLSLTEAAKALHCHPNTIRAWVRQGKLVPLPMGEEKVNMFRKTDVERLKRPLEEAGVIIKEDKHAFPVVGIGASAGGLDALSRLLQHLPTDLGLAYVFVTHQEKDQEKTLSDLLRKKTAMPVFVVENGMRLEPDRLYINPAGLHTAVVNGTFTMQAPRGQVDSARRPIDAFFIALAHEYQNNSIGIVLSGGGMDGTEGLRAIKAEDGLTIAQDDSAQDPSMPRSAREADVVDLVRKPEDIGAELAQLVKELFPGGKARIPSKHENELRRILQYVLEQRGVDFSEYKEATIHRRIIRRMVLSKCRKLSEYSALLRGIPTELDTLYNDLLINVTSFFRDPAFYKALSERVFPELFDDRVATDALRIWVPACAGGEEVVSIAITLLEFLGEQAMNNPVQIFATDLNERTIEKARLGIYKKSALQDLAPERLAKFFMHVDGHYQVIKPIRDMCVFAKHDLLKDPPFSRVDLISCQNVLIYLENAAQGRILKSFHYALKPVGFLVLGKSETPANAGDIFVQPDRDHKVYRKKRRGGERLNLDLRYKPAPPPASTNGTPPPGPRLQGPRADMDREMEQVLLQRYVPASVLVNKDLEIVRFRGSTAPFLGPSTGKASLGVLKMVRDDLAFELRSLLQKARKEMIPVRKSGIPIRLNTGLQDVGIEVLPMGGTRDPHFLIIFREEGTPALDPAPSRKPGSRTIDAREKRIALLEQELRDAREQVRSISEESEVTMQELQASNEEVVSSNEELQSINEELETSKEELQSINEEFATINEELQSRNDALRESEERLQLATRTGKVGIWDWDVVADKITWSDSLYAIHGVAPDTFDASVKGFSALVHADDRERVAKAIDAALKLDARFEVEFRAVRPDGQVIWLFSNASVLRSNGRALRLLGATLDITDRKATETALHQRTYALERMNALGDALIAELDTEKIVQAVTDTGREVTGAAFGAFFYNVTNEDGKSYMLYTLSGLPREAFANFPMPRATDLFGPTFRGEGVIRIGDVRKDPRYGHMAPHHGMPKGHIPVRSYLAVPVTSRNGKVLGGLFFGHPEPDQFGPEAEGLVVALAAQAAMAVDNADLHSALQRELEQQRLAQEQLKASEERFRLLADNMDQLAWIAEADGSAMWFNQRWVEFSGIPVDEIRERSRAELHHPDHFERVTASLRAAADRSENWEDTFPLKGKDGTWHWFLSRAIPVRDEDGKIYRWFGTSTDVTAQRAAQEELRTSEERYRQLISTLPVAVFTCDERGKILLYNQACVALWGGTPAKGNGQWHGAPGLFTKSGERIAAEDSPMARAIKEGRSVRDEVIVERGDGSRRIVLVHPEPIFDAAGKVIGGYNVLVDITDLKESEGALIASEERFKAIYERAPFGISLVSVPEGRIMDLNPAFADMIGWPREEVLGKTSLELGLHADPSVRRRIMDEILRSGSTRDLEVRVQHRSGKPVDVRTSSDVVTMGGQTYIMSVYENITERKLGEERLRVATQTGKLGIWDWDVLSDTITWTDPVYEIHGVKKGAFLPTMAGYTNLIHPEDRERVGRSIQATLEQDVPYEIEFRTLNEQGEVNWVFTNAVVIREHGKPVRMMGGTMNITQRKLTEEAARRLAAIVESSDDAILSKDLDGTITSWNSAAERIFGYTASEIIGKPNTLLYEEDRHQEESQLFDRLKKGERIEHYETIRVHKDGTPVAVALTLSPLKNEQGEIIGASKTIRDITQEKRAREVLRESEERFHLLADNMSQMAYVADAEGATIWVNRRWIDYTGLDVPDMRSEGWRQVVDPEHFEAMVSSFQTALRTGRQWEHIFRLKSKDGDYRWFLSRSVPIRDEGGKVQRWFGTNTDITEQKLAEQALEETARHKDHFLATLAHELRNPLAPLKNGLQLMELSPDDPATLENTRSMMVRQLDHMVRLVDDLMDLSRISRGKIELLREPAELAGILATAIETSKPLIERNEHHLQVHIGPGSMMVNGDAARLTQVVANLLNNAAKYTPAGGRIEINMEREGEEAVIRVKDNGIGIEPEAMPHVFDMFAQVDPAQKTQAGGGLGIGLNIVQSLVHMHQGRVEGHSAGVGQGSEFIVRLPLIRHAAPSPPSARPAKDKRPGPQRRVLVVDDNHDAALSMAMLLKRRGHDVRVSHNGEQALVEGAAFLPEVVLMDIGMPKMNGYDACAHMRASDWGRSISIIALSGWGQEEDRRRSEEAGFDQHVVKPIDGATLERVIAEAR